MVDIVTYNESFTVSTQDYTSQIKGFSKIIFDEDTWFLYIDDDNFFASQYVVKDDITVTVDNWTSILASTLISITGGGGGGEVLSVNGKTGQVILTASDILMADGSTIEDAIDNIDIEHIDGGQI